MPKKPAKKPLGKKSMKKTRGGAPASALPPKPGIRIGTPINLHPTLIPPTCN